MPLRQHTPTPKRSLKGRPRRSVLVVASFAVPLVVVGGAGAVLAATNAAAPAAPAAAPTTPAAAPAASPADPNPNCSLVLPADPLSAKGLATPYQAAVRVGIGGRSRR